MSIQQKSGFTLTEILISLGIFLLLLGITTPYVLNFYKRYQLNAERTKIVALLRKSRSMSMNGENGQDHGLYIASSQYTIFEGISYLSRNMALDEIFDRELAVIMDYPSEIIFKYLHGTSASKSFSLTNGSKTGYIYVNTAGTIDWE